MCIRYIIWHSWTTGLTNEILIYCKYDEAHNDYRNQCATIRLLRFSSPAPHWYTRIYHIGLRFAQFSRQSINRPSYRENDQWTYRQWDENREILWKITEGNDDEISRTIGCTLSKYQSINGLIARETKPSLSSAPVIAVNQWSCILCFICKFAKFIWRVCSKNDHTCRNNNMLLRFMSFAGHVFLISGVHEPNPTGYNHYNNNVIKM